MMLKKFLVIIIFIPLQLQSTFSIVAIDTATGEVGSAGASCISNSIIISDIHPGIGAIHTQSYWNSNNQDSASYLMDLGYSPQEIVDWLINNDAENDPSIRQYGIISLIDEGSRSAYTGENCFEYKNHILGPNYVIAGNILLGQTILDTIEHAFISTSGNLEDKLIAAIMAANISGADTRCSPYGTPAISSFIRIAKFDNNSDSLYLDIDVNNAPLTINPLDSLFILFWDWKVSHFSIGDLNFDRKVDLFDILNLADYLNSFVELSNYSLNNADINNSGEVELTDLYLLIYQISGTLVR